MSLGHSYAAEGVLVGVPDPVVRRHSMRQPTQGKGIQVQLVAFESLASERLRLGLQRGDHVARRPLSHGLILWCLRIRFVMVYFHLVFYRSHRRAIGCGGGTSLFQSFDKDTEVAGYHRQSPCLI